MGARLVLSLLLYLGFSSILVSMVAGGMGYGVEGLDSSLSFEPPEESGFLGGTATMITTFLTTVFTVLFWNVPTEIFPWAANVIFIKIPLVGFVAAVIEVLLP